MRYGSELTSDSIVFVEEQKSTKFEAIVSVDVRFAVSWRIHERRSFCQRSKVRKHIQKREATDRFWKCQMILLRSDVPLLAICN